MTIKASEDHLLNTSSTRLKTQSSVRLKILFILVCASFASTAYLYYGIGKIHSELRNTEDEIRSEDDKIIQLKEIISQQQGVIDKFRLNDSNQDVNERINQLETDFNRTKSSIADTLKETIQNFDESVQYAEKQIHSEVASMKVDVDQYVLSTQDQFSLENSFMVYQLAGTFTLIASLISMWHMTGHLRNLRRPHIQRKILAILMMTPIYGITSWLSLVFPKIEGYLAIIKDLYEAYVIYQFLGFLISVLGKGDRDVVVDKLAHHAAHLVPPIRLCGWFRKKRQYASSRQLANAVLLQCQVFAMQFVFLKPLTATSIFVCNKLGYFSGSGNLNYKSIQFWIIALQNVSVTMAFSGLLKFYHAVHEDLAWCRPFPKFLCIKGIVFVTFWQGLVISILASTSVTGRGSGHAGEDPNISGRQAQNFLICLEMLLFSIFHFHCFPTEEWQENYQPSQLKDTQFGDNIALRDFFSDLKVMMNSRKKLNEDDCKSNSSHTSTVDETRKQDNGNDVDNGYSVDATACSDLSPDSDIHKDVDSVFYQENGIVADNKDIIDEDDRLIRDISDHVLKGLNKESGNSWKGESDHRTLCTKLKNESDLDGSSEFTSLLDGGSKNDKYIS